MLPPPSSLPRADTPPASPSAAPSPGPSSAASTGPESAPRRAPLPLTTGTITYQMIVSRACPTCNLSLSTGPDSTIFSLQGHRWRMRVTLDRVADELRQRPAFFSPRPSSSSDSGDSGFFDDDLPDAHLPDRPRRSEPLCRLLGHAGPFIEGQTISRTEMRNVSIQKFFFKQTDEGSYRIHS